MMNGPLGIYINWSAYDELSDKVQLTETLAMDQFAHFLRLRAAGARLDCYLMDCFWYAPDGAYRTWRAPQWSDHGTRWLAACRAHGVLPGMWFGCNSVGPWMGLQRHHSWVESIEPSTEPNAGGSYCLFEGPFLNGFLAALGHWYTQGVRVFKLDFLNQDAHLPHHRLHLLPSEIRAANALAFRSGLARFRAQHPEAVVIGYNGFEEVHSQSTTDGRVRRTMDSRWLEALDGFYVGDPRPADVPAARFWRAKDVYSDHQVRRYLAQGFARQVLDNAGFMIGTTGTCYHRGTEAWKGMLLLSLARGGWLNTYYGNLDLLSAEDMAWFARAQRLFWPLLAHGTMTVLGGMPGEGGVYGFRLADGNGSLTAVVNAGQVPGTLAVGDGKILFRDAGFVPRLDVGEVTVGPEQLVLIGSGAYQEDLGVQEDVVIPASSVPLVVTSRAAGHQAVEAEVAVPASGRLRIVMRQRGSDGLVKRTSGGAPPHGRTLGSLLTIGATQDGVAVPVEVAYDKAIWSGLSWAVGEIAVERLKPGVVTVRVASGEVQPVAVTVECYVVG